MQRVSRKIGLTATLVFVGALLSGCSKKDNYAADTSAAAIDTTSSMTASSTAPAVQDTAAAPAQTATKSTTKKSTTKTAPKRPTY